MDDDKKQTVNVCHLTFHVEAIQEKLVIDRLYNIDAIQVHEMKIS